MISLILTLTLTYVVVVTIAMTHGRVAEMKMNANVVGPAGSPGLFEKEKSLNRNMSSVGFSIPPGYVRVDDMILPESWVNGSNRNAIVNPAQKWPRGKIPYTIDYSLGHYRSQILRAMEEYHARTCVRFVPRSNEVNYVQMFSGDGCYSLLGRSGQGQPLSLGQGCTDHGTIVHELGHAIGFHHEQNRSDRDDHIIIHWENIQPEYHSQFQKLDPSENWLINGFDVNSIMMYGATAFSSDGYSTTMSSRYGYPLIETYAKTGLSYSDIQRVNKLYGC